MNENYNPNENKDIDGTPHNPYNQAGDTGYPPAGEQRDAWNQPPQENGQGYRPPYYAEQQREPQVPQTPPPAPPPYGNAGQQYSQTNGWQQRAGAVPPSKEPYQWKFSDYENAQEKKPKRRKKGLIVFSIVMCSVLVVSLMAFAGVGIYNTFLTDTPQNEDTNSLQVPADTLPGMTLHDKPQSNDPAPAAGSRLTTEQVVEKVEPSVVAITTYINYQNYKAEGMGSGIIIRSDGYIVTNAHVVEGARGITVRLSDDQEFEGRIVGSDSKTDLAVLKIDAANLPAATFGNSDQIKVGEKVIAIGNPQSMDFVGSVTQGIVSGLNRQMTAYSQDGSNPTHYANLIQTDAAINPGNSGGALVNEYGQVIGINSAKLIKTGAEGMGFAIPANEAKPIVDDLINFGRVTGRVRLGVTATTVDEVLARLNRVPTGLLVQSTEQGSDISAKGVIPGDIITKVNDKEIVSLQTLTDEISGKKPGDTVKLEVYRASKRPNAEGRFFEVTVKLIEDMGDTDTGTGDNTQYEMPQQQMPPNEQQNPDYDELEDFFNYFFN